MLDFQDAVEGTELGVKTRRGGAKTRRRGGADEKHAAVKGLSVPRVFTRPGVAPFDEIEWDRRKAAFGDDKGKVVFCQDDVEVPKSWSMLATNVVTSKYFYGRVGSEQRETSVRQLVHRVTRTITECGKAAGYFATAEDAETFYNELSFLCVNQYGSFNSPVWFNVGLHHIYGCTSSNRAAYRWDPQTRRVVQAEDAYRYPQASACFIQSVDDTMEDIMRLAGSEAMLFKYGSGTGTDLSTLRSSRERLSGGGTPSGPLSFMRVFDQVAAVIKSGGKTRRAAKMQSLKCWHPDIMEFITCKANEEKKAWALIEQGYDGSFGGEAYESVMFQNANLSVRVTDEFMRAVESDGRWSTRAITTGEPMMEMNARAMMRTIAECAHVCGDPGLQYDTTINRWHTCKNSAPINASNPCSEYMFVDDSACNLASINLMKLVDEAGTFDTERFKHVVRIFILAQEILIDSSSYPTERIALNSHRFRPLGLGYANLGALIMRLGYPYDSQESRGFAASVTALMTGQAYATSIELAETLGTFDGFAENRDCMVDVMRMHRGALERVDRATAPAAILDAARATWDAVVAGGMRVGFRNAQTTVLAPTGTIGFMMDCDTTGVEPDIALIKYKQLAGGGTMKIVNRTLRPALSRLGYPPEVCDRIVAYVDEEETIEGSPDLRPEHLPVFDCAFKARQGKRSIPYTAHLRMMAAVQPFLSGAISKTVNMPTEATVEDIVQTYTDGWKLGLKAVAIYRDGSKRTQPLNTSATKAGPERAAEAAAEPRPTPFRRRMPATRTSLTHKFEVAGHEGYLTVGMYEDGAPGELFITMAKEGSTVGGTMDSFGTAISLCLQYGVPIKELCQKFAHSRFEPSGYTRNPDIRHAKSIIDYIFRWLDLTFPDGRCGLTLQARQPPQAQPKPEQVEPEPEPDSFGTSAATAPAEGLAGAPAAPNLTEQFRHFTADAPACDVCGGITVRNGTCYRCHNCGNSMGCS